MLGACALEMGIHMKKTCLLPVILMLVSLAVARAENDPFKPHLDGQAPEIVREVASTNAPDLLRVFRMNIAGRATGAKAEDEVGLFIRRLRDPASGGALFKSITLLSMQAPGPEARDAGASSFAM